MRHSWTHSRFGKMALATAVLSGFLLVPGVATLRADNDDCQRRSAKAEQKLDDAVRKHGAHSKQAEKRRNDLRAAREGCWNSNHRWWNARENRWHSDRDWDDHDHDRDRDRDHDKDRDHHDRDHDHDNEQH